MHFKIARNSDDFYLKLRMVAVWTLHRKRCQRERRKDIQRFEIIISIDTKSGKPQAFTAFGKLEAIAEISENRSELNHKCCSDVT